MLGPRGRLVRSSFTALVLVLLILGTFVGDDDAFPFGPFKMYAGTARLNDPVPVLKFEGVDTRGAKVIILAKDFGLRPAEVEGQLDDVRTDPKLLDDIVRAYEKLHFGDLPLQTFRVLYGTYKLENGRPVSYSEEVLAEWERS